MIFLWFVDLKLITYFSFFNLYIIKLLFIGKKKLKNVVQALHVLIKNIEKWQLFLKAKLVKNYGYLKIIL